VNRQSENVNKEHHHPEVFGFPSKTIRRILTRSFRLIRIGVGCIIVSTIVFNIVMPQLLPVTGKSVVNARLDWIRTPIQGNVIYQEITEGSKVEAGQHFGTILNSRADDNFLNQLRLQKSSIETTRISLSQRFKQLKSEKKSLSSRLGDSLDALKHASSLRIDALYREISEAEAKKRLTEDRLDRYTKANTQYSNRAQFAVVSEIQIEEVLAELKNIVLTIDSKKISIVQEKTLLETVTNGGYDNVNTPQEQRRLEEIEKELVRISAELSTLESVHEKTEKKISNREQYLENIRTHDLISPVEGIVWDIGFSDGSYVNDGDSVVGIARLDTLTVECLFHQRYLGTIEVGDHATVRLMGSNTKVSGHVSMIQIRDKNQSKVHNAFSFNKQTPEEFKVVVTLSDDNSHIPILGQRAKVIINKGKFNILEKIVLMINK